MPLFLSILKKADKKISIHSELATNAVELPRVVFEYGVRSMHVYERDDILSIIINISTLLLRKSRM